MDDQRKIRGKFPWGVLIVLGIVGCIVAYFAVPPRVSCTLVRNTDGTLRLEVGKNFKVNSIMNISLSVPREQKPIWETAFQPTPVESATINLHDGGAAAHGRLARPLLTGERFSIQVDYQFDSAIPPAACADRQQFHFRIAPDGHPEYLGTSR